MSRDAMSVPAITVDDLGKLYRIGLCAKTRRTLRETINDWATAPLRRLRNLSGGATDNAPFWALRNISFEVEPGEVVGIIGRNGAGKSTLLKILSRITEPTEGRALIRGRVRSLLEVGTGFHPELTGRENIYLNAAILGMRKTELDRKFDEIVAFAETEQFLDTPVKRYSTGMRVRLGFAVAAYLDPEILIVDEVLSVGDAAFRRKCLGKMGDVAGSGRTILFVSHNMSAIQGLCQRAIVLEGGRIAFDGGVDQGVHHYLASMQREESIPLADRKDRKGSGVVRFTSVNLCDAHGNRLPYFSTGRDAVLELAFECPRTELQNLHVAIGVDNNTGLRVANLDSDATGDTFGRVSPETRMLRLHIDRMPLLPGRYRFTIYATVNEVVADWIQNAGQFDVEAGDYYSTGKLPPGGNICMDCHFELGSGSRQCISATY